MFRLVSGMSDILGPLAPDDLDALATLWRAAEAMRTRIHLQLECSRSIHYSKKG